MPLVHEGNDDRVKGALVAVAIEAALLYLLITGLALHLPAWADEALKRFTLSSPSPPPPPKTVPQRARQRASEGAAAPPNLKSSATEIVAPVPVIPPPLPPPVIVAPIAGTGVRPTAGNALVRGPGPGAGGQGIGTGSGDGGDGAGGGDWETPPRWLRGRLKDSDYPRDLSDAGISGTVSVRYTVAITGRVSDCTVTGSSGSARLDTLTCRLIGERFRFAPSRDADGVAVPAIIVENHSWLIEDPPEPRPSR